MQASALLYMSEKAAESARYMAFENQIREIRIPSRTLAEKSQDPVIPA